MWGRFLRLLGIFIAIAAAAFWFLTMPQGLGVKSELEVSVLAGNAGRGERIFLIGGCAACHAAKDAKDDDRRILSGGRRFVSDFGTFIAPNISPDPTHGIGGWTLGEFANAMMRGVSPDGQHYYPAFPYTSYRRMQPIDVADLWAFLRTLPASERADVPHEVGFPFNIRRGLGIWKQLYFNRLPAEIAAIDAETPEIDRGRYLVEGPGHCGECHTPRDGMGGLELDRWMAGAPSPDGPGKIPNLTPAGKGISGWSAEDISYYLESGFKPDYDTAGGAMVDVIENTSRLPAEDRAAIAAYLKALPEVAGAE